MVDLESYPLPKHIRFYMGETLGYENGQAVRVGPIFPSYNGPERSDSVVFYLIYDDALGRQWVLGKELPMNFDEPYISDAIAELQKYLTETS